MTKTWATTDNIQIVHTGTIHIVPTFSNTALCGALIHGKIRPSARPSNCADCQGAAR